MLAEVAEQLFPPAADRLAERQHGGQRPLLRELLEQDLARDVARLQNTSIRQRIMHLVAHTLGANNPALAQQSEMLAHFGLSLAEQSGYELGLEPGRANSGKDRRV